LALVVVTIFGRIVPRHVAFFSVIPDTSEWVLRLWSTVEGSRGTPPFRVGGRRDLHVGLHFTLHVRLAFGALIILVGLPKLSTGIRNWVFTVHQVPRVLVACVVLYGLLHRLSQESSNVDKSVDMPIGTVVAHKEVFVSHAVIVHNT